MTKAERTLFELYKKRTGKELTIAEIQQANRNVIRFLQQLAEPEATPPRDSNRTTDCSVETYEKPVKHSRSRSNRK